MLHENEIAKIVVEICFKILVSYGPGLFESVYEAILCFELDKRAISYKGNVVLKFSMKEMIWE